VKTYGLIINTRQRRRYWSERAILLFNTYGVASR